MPAKNSWLSLDRLFSARISNWPPVVRDDHASYLANWLTILKNEKRAIFQAASYAQKAVDHLHSRQPDSKAAAA
jgi:antirestriction protein ArdC